MRLESHGAMSYATVELSNDVFDVTDADDDILVGQPKGRAAVTPVAHNQRVMDKVAQAFNHACDLVDTEVAERLAQIMDRMVAERSLKADGTRRRAVETLVAAHERLWELRHADSRFETIAEEQASEDQVSEAA